MGKKKWYVVWYGREKGVFSTWDACQKQVKNFPNARFKSFPSKVDAEEAFSDDPQNHIGRSQANATKSIQSISPKCSEVILRPSLSVDAACSGNPGVMEYQGVYTESSERIFHRGPFQQATNNIGEFLALVDALRWLQKENHVWPIYSDSRTAMAWVRKGQVRTSLKKNKTNEQLFQLISEALEWLQNCDELTPILKWETKEWGEIPADFGRK